GGDRDPDRIAVLAGLVAESAPLADELAVGVEVLDSPVSDIEDEERAVLGERQRAVPVAVLASEVELAGPAAGRAPFLEELARCVEDRDLVAFRLRCPDPTGLRLD